MISKREVMKTVKYKVTTMVGNFKRGDTIDVKLYLKGADGEALILHESDPEHGFSSCIEICVQGSDGLYYPKSPDAWMNLNE